MSLLKVKQLLLCSAFSVVFPFNCGVGLLLCIHSSAGLWRFLLLPTLGNPRSTLSFLEAGGDSPMASRDLYSQGCLEITGGCLGTVWAFLPVVPGVQAGHCSRVDPFSIGLSRPDVWFHVSQAYPRLSCSWSVLSPAVCQPLVSQVPQDGARPDSWWGAGGSGV